MLPDVTLVSLPVTLIAFVVSGQTVKIKGYTVVWKVLNKSLFLNLFLNVTLIHLSYNYFVGSLLQSSHNSLLSCHLQYLEFIISVCLI